MASQQEQSRDAQGGAWTYRAMCAHLLALEPDTTAISVAAFFHDGLVAGFYLLDVGMTAATGEPHFILSELGARADAECGGTGANRWAHKPPAQEAPSAN